ncbi:MAG: ureidoglycolate lyase [Prochlorotrichaceae cyanobacterium]|jgi:ureidoglycolate hydrolase
MHIFLTADLATPTNFQDYGQVILVTPDGKSFDHKDAQLVLSPGTPRFYLMRLSSTGRQFHRITRHQRCTQCLGSLGGQSWWLGVCPPSLDDRPDRSQLKVFEIPGDRFIKLHQGTWHAGPLFESEFIDFYNLELSDTNTADHFTHDFLALDGVTFGF